jgi:hypothetical protein
MKLKPHRDPAAEIAFRWSPDVTIRWAKAADEPLIHRLAQLDESPVPDRPLLLGWVGHELWVAASPSTGAFVAEPFRPSAEVAALVIQRGLQLTASQGRVRRRGAMGLWRLRRGLQGRAPSALLGQRAV